MPVDGSTASLQAVALACDVASENRGKVFVVHVIEIKRALPLDAEVEPQTAAGDEILSKAEQTARELNFDVEGEILQARDAAHAIVDESVERGVDLIILGSEYHQPFGEFELGRVIQYVLKSAPCEVWVRREQEHEQH